MLNSFSSKVEMPLEIESKRQRNDKLELQRGKLLQEMQTLRKNLLYTILLFYKKCFFCSRGQVVESHVKSYCHMINRKNFKVENLNLKLFSSTSHFFLSRYIYKVAFYQLKVKYMYQLFYSNVLNAFANSVRFVPL